MATTSRLESPPLTARTASAQPELERLLEETPTAVGFFQAMRLLEILHPDREPVGGFGDPAREVVRIGVNPATSFPPSEIAGLELEPGDQPRMTVNFMGLNGPQGVMPLVYSSLVAERARARDRGPAAFVDLFNHRMISLFYRAWGKMRITVASQRDGYDRFTSHLRDLIGLGTPGLQGRLGLPDEVLLFYSGLLAPKGRPVTALEQLIEDYFGVRAEVEQFVGAWYPVDEATQCRLGDEEDESTQLGIGAVAGDEIWDHQSRIRLRLGPMTRRQYDRFLPDGDAHGPLAEITRFFTSDEVDVEVQLVLARDEVPACSLGVDDDSPPSLGWCTWLRSEPFAHDADDTILTLHPDPVTPS
jgi:type VI secretion system protein ImpH